MGLCRRSSRDRSQPKQATSRKTPPQTSRRCSAEKHQGNFRTPTLNRLRRSSCRSLPPTSVSVAPPRRGAGWLLPPSCPGSAVLPPGAPPRPGLHGGLGRRFAPFGGSPEIPARLIRPTADRLQVDLPGIGLSRPAFGHGTTPQVGQADVKASRHRRRRLIGDIGRPDPDPGLGPPIFAQPVVLHPARLAAACVRSGRRRRSMSSVSLMSRRLSLKSPAIVLATAPGCPR